MRCGVASHRNGNRSVWRSVAGPRKLSRAWLPYTSTSRAAKFHRLSPSDIPVTARSDLTCTVQTSTDRRAEQWSQRRQLDKNQVEAIVGSVTDIRTAAVEEERQEITPDGHYLAIREVKTRTALGPDAWGPAVLAALRWQRMATPADLINAIEAKVAWPRQVLHVWYVLLTKLSGEIESGEERPIACWVRTWERVRRPGLANWCQQRAGHWDAAVAKSSALRATVLSMTLDETAAVLATPTMTLYLDLAKFL